MCAALIVIRYSQVSVNLGNLDMGDGSRLEQDARTAGHNRDSDMTM